jgi:6-phosphogluconolactonase
VPQATPNYEGLGGEEVKRKVLAILSVVIIVASAFAVIAVGNAGLGKAGAVYTIDNDAAGNNVLYYSRARDGSITFLDSFPTNGLGTGARLGSQGALALTENGRFLLVVNAGSDEISVFRVQSSSGLTYLSKVSSHGTMPISLTVYRNWVYVLNAGDSANIAGFKLSKTGVLTYIEGSNQPLSGMSDPSPEQIGFSPNGRVLVVTEKNTNLLDTYIVDRYGVASAPTTYESIGDGPYAFAFTDRNKMILSEAASDTMTSYVVSYQGDLRTISGAMPTFGAAPCWVVIDDKGNFAYETNAADGTISTFSISRSGAINLVSAISAKMNVPALDMAFSNNDRFLYVLNGDSITGFKVYSDGSLSWATSVNAVPGSATGLAAS